MGDCAFPTRMKLWRTGTFAVMHKTEEIRPGEHSAVPGQIPSRLIPNGILACHSLAPRLRLCHAGAFNLTQDWEELAQEYSQLYPVEILQAVLNGSLNDPSFDVTSLLPSGVSFQDPMFFDDQASNVSSTLQVRAAPAWLLPQGAGPRRAQPSAQKLATAHCMCSMCPARALTATRTPSWHVHCIFSAVAGSARHLMQYAWGPVRLPKWHGIVAHA